MVYLLVGAPCTGKSWVATRVANVHFEVVPHDRYRVAEYAEAVFDVAKRDGHLPVLAEAPFRASIIQEELEERGVVVVPVYLWAPDDTLRERYLQRTGKEIPRQHLTNNAKYRLRGMRTGNFVGDSTTALHFLRGEFVEVSDEFMIHKCDCVGVGSNVQT